jgi:hypothetical protein
MTLTSDHLTGFVVGLGAAALGYYMYKKNETQVDDFLRSQGIEVPGKESAATSSMTLKELVAEKERLEDLIAEKEMVASGDTSPA